MSQELLTHTQAKKILLTTPGAKFKRQTWDECKHIRMAVESDYDLINYDINGLIVEDCEQKKCDCKIGVWAFTPEDVKAQDYIQLQ